MELSHLICLGVGLVTGFAVTLAWLGHEDAQNTPDDPEPGGDPDEHIL